MRLMIIFIVISSCAYKNNDKVEISEIFNNYKGDFYAIDANLFSPGKVKITSLDTGKVFIEGKLNNDLLDKSFEYEEK